MSFRTNVTMHYGLTCKVPCPCQVLKSSLKFLSKASCEVGFRLTLKLKTRI